MADQVYNALKKDNLFSHDNIENLHLLMSQVRLTIKGTEYRLKYNFINFSENLSKPSKECAIKLDLSLIPHFSHTAEYILWLAGFIENITEGGSRTPPPIKKYIPEMYTLKLEFQNQSTKENKKRDHAEAITKYFNNHLYK